MDVIGTAPIATAPVAATSLLNTSTTGTTAVPASGGIMSKIPWKYILFTVAIAAAVGLIAFIVIKSRKTVPLNEGFAPAATAANTVTPPVADQLSGDAAVLYNAVAPAAAQTPTGRADLAELATLLYKMSAFRTDLEAPTKAVKATMGIPYTTSHDREPVAEMTGRCLAKTVPKRELDIALETWRNRGQAVVYRLAKAAGIDTAQAAQQFAGIWQSVYTVAESQCIAGEPAIAGKPVSPREAVPNDIDIIASGAGAPY